MSVEWKPSHDRKGRPAELSPHWSEMDLAVCFACVMS